MTLLVAEAAALGRLEGNFVAFHICAPLRAPGSREENGPLCSVSLCFFNVSSLCHFPACARFLQAGEGLILSLGPLLASHGKKRHQSRFSSTPINSPFGSIRPT